jgi:N-methylhydantoinase A
MQGRTGSSYRIGCDIGGTFTDFVLFEEKTGQVIIEKCLSTPRDPSEGLMNGLNLLREQAGDYFSAISQIAHASTLVANAVIERKGAKCALLCTKGFRDVLEVRRHVRVTTYELWADPPEPLIPRYLRIPVDERVYSDGSVVRPVDPDQIADIVQILKDENVQSVAIAFLHSYVNPANEREARRLIENMLPGIPVTISSDVLPQIKEYERTSTTVVNAYVRPIVERYLANLTSRLRSSGIKAPVHIMLSNGGVASPTTAQQYPIRLIESGPVAGAKVVQHYRDICGLDDALAFDMGGTTAKACLIQNGEIPITNELEVARSQRFTKSSGYPIAVPGAHLIEIGAGGGSIAQVNGLGLIQVGPESASSEPGPACYGRGGTQPTVTDSDLVLGYLNPEYFAGGSISLNRAKSEEAIQTHVGEKVGRDLIASAWSIHDVINETMASAVRMHMTERGGLLDKVSMVAFGGAGPVHAYNLAAKLGIKRVIIPLRAGVLSAAGLIIAPPAYDVVRTFRADLNNLSQDAIEKAYAEIEAEIEAVLREVEPSGGITFARSADIGYVGQGYQVTVPIGGEKGGLRTDSLWSKFAEIYRAKYGYFYDDIQAELVNLRVNGTIHGAQFRPKPIEVRGWRLEDSIKGVRPAFSADAAAIIDFSVYDRQRLEPGMVFTGPAIVEEISSTTVIDAGGSIHVDSYGSLVISVGPRPR